MKKQDFSPRLELHGNKRRPKAISTGSGLGMGAWRWGRWEHGIQSRSLQFQAESPPTPTILQASGPASVHPWKHPRKQARKQAKHRQPSSTRIHNPHQRCPPRLRSTPTPLLTGTRPPAIPRPEMHGFIELLFLCRHRHTSKDQPDRLVGRSVASSHSLQDNTAGHCFWIEASDSGMIPSWLDGWNGIPVPGL